MYPYRNIGKHCAVIIPNYVAYLVSVDPRRRQKLLDAAVVVLNTRVIWSNDVRGLG